MAKGGTLENIGMALSGYGSAVSGNPMFLQNSLLMRQAFDQRRQQEEQQRQQQVGNASAMNFLRSASMEGTPATKQYTVPAAPGVYPDFVGRTVGQNREAIAPNVDPLRMLAAFSNGDSPLQSLAAKQAIEMLGMGQKAAPIISKPGDVARDANGNILWQNPEQKETSDIERRALAAGYTPGTPGFQEFIKTATLRPNSVTNVNMPDARGDVKYMEEMGKLVAEDFANVQRAGAAAQTSLSKFERLGGLLESANTGTFKGTTTQIKALAKAAGMDLESLGVTDDVAPAQAAKAITNEIALQLRNPAGGAGMPGAMSDKDREFLVAMVPSLETTPEGNKLLVDYWRRINKRSIEVAKQAREYMKKNKGRFDYGFYDDLAEYSDKNPLFPEADKVKPPAIAAPSATPRSLNQLLDQYAPIQ